MSTTKKLSPVRGGGRDKAREAEANKSATKTVDKKVTRGSNSSK